MSPAEHELLQRCRDRDESAWRELYRTYAPTVERFLRSMGTHDSEVEDALQRVFIELLRAIGRFRGDARLSTYLYRIAARVSSKAGKRRSRWLLTFKPMEDYHAASMEDARTPEARVAARGSLDVVSAALDELPFKFRVVWVMREIEGLSTEEAGAALGIPVPTVRTRHFRARKHILGAVEAAERDHRSPHAASSLATSKVEVTP